MSDGGGREITEVLDRVAAAGEEAGEEAGDDAAHVTVGEIVERMGDRSFAPLLLTPALIVVSPVSGIPGVPTVAAAIIALIAAQMLVGRERLWLPEVVRRRSVPARRLTQAMGFLKTPVGWIEPLLKPRLGALARRPGSYGAILACFAITLVMPPMEVVPMLGSIAAGAISLLAAGLLVRDGLLVLMGYAIMLGGGALAWRFLMGGG